MQVSLQLLLTMRLLAVALACLVSAGHGSRVPMTNQRPTYQARLSGAPDSRDSLASLLVVRGGDLVRKRHSISESGIDLVQIRGGKLGLGNKRGGFKQLLTPSRGAAPRTTSEKVPVIGQAAGIRAASGSRQLRQAFGSQVRKSIAKSDAVLVQGGSLKTWSYKSVRVNRVQVVLTTDGRPLDADVQLWQGPDNTPIKMRVYCEDGSSRPFSAVLESPGGGDNTVAVFNTGNIEFPLAAFVRASDVEEPISDFDDTSIIVQGGALRTFNFDISVESVEIMLKTDGRPLNARVELLQGPNNNKQVIELYSEDGLERPFFAVIETMGGGNVVRVVNTAPMEFPLTASVQPHSVDEKMSPTDPVVGGN